MRSFIIKLTLIVIGIASSAPSISQDLKELLIGIDKVTIEAFIYENENRDSLLIPVESVLKGVDSFEEMMGRYCELKELTANECTDAQDNKLRRVFQEAESAFKSREDHISPDEIERYVKVILDYTTTRKEGEALSDHLENELNSLAASYRTAYSEQVKMKEKPTVKNEQSAVTNSGVDWALILSILALVVSGFTLYKTLEQGKRIIVEKEKRRDLKERHETLKASVSDNSRSLRQTTENVDKAVRKSSELEQKVSNIDDAGGKVSESGVIRSDDRNDGSVKDQVSEVSPEPPKPKPIFALYADLKKGFSSSMIKDVPNDETIYEFILANEDEGEYKVREDRMAQEYAKQDFNILLSCACDFKNEPSANATIITSELGKVRRSNDGWEIIKRAQVSFQ